MKISIKQLNIRKQNNRPNVWRRSRVWQNSGCGFLGRKNGESLECLQNPLEVGRRKIGEIRRKEIGKFQYNKGIGEDVINLYYSLSSSPLFQSILSLFEISFQEFRIMMDKKREMYEALSPEEQVEYKDSIRHFRHPDFAKKSGTFYDLDGNEVEKDPYSTYTSAFRMKMKEKFNIDLNNAKHGTDNSLDANNSFASQDPTPPERRKAYRQDSLSNYNLKKSKQNKNLETSNSRTSSDSMQNEDLLSEMIMQGTVTKNQIKDQTNYQELKGQSNDQAKKQEVDDVIKEMNSPNPSNDFYKRTGPAVHYTQENEDKKFRESHEASKRLESLREDHTEDPFETGKTDIQFPKRDPMMGVAYSKGVSNKNADIPYHAQWKHNIDERSKLNIHSDDSRDSFVKSKSFLTFLVTLLLSICYVLIKESKGHDNPVSAVNVKSRNKTEN